MKVFVVPQGRYSAVILSIAVHIGLAFLLIKNTDFSNTQTSKKAPAIKSYIYTPPPVKRLPQIEQPLLEEVNTLRKEQKTEPLPEQIKKQPEKKKIEKTSVATITPPNAAPPAALETLTELEKQLDEIRPPEKLLKQKSVKAKSISRSAYSQLEKLNQTLDQRFIENETYERYRKRSASVLDGEPYSVPHSVQQLTPEQYKEKNTTRMADDLSIIKGDDGLCYIEQNLTSVGIEGVKAISGFACGESKFDKGFKSHMKKVLKKLGK